MICSFLRMFAGEMQDFRTLFLNHPVVQQFAYEQDIDIRAFLHSEHVYKQSELYKLELALRRHGTQMLHQMDYKTMITLYIEHESDMLMREVDTAIQRIKRYAALTETLRKLND